MYLCIYSDWITYLLVLFYNQSKRLSHLGYRTWYSKAKESAQSYDTDIANVGDMISSKQAIKNNIGTTFQSYVLTTFLNRTLHAKTTYIYYKNDKHRTTLSKFRTSSHNLEVEWGRNTNLVTPLERR